MSQILDNIKKELDAFNEKKKALTEQLREEFPAMFAPFFEASKRIESFGWNQYTPHFNDGDACTFGVHNDDIYVNGEHQDEAEWLDWRVKYEKYHEELKAAGAVDFEEAKIVEDIKKVLSSVPDEFYEELFGDHVQVTIHKSGTIEVEEYEHD